MAYNTTPKFVLASLLTIILISTLFGINYLMKSVPSTGYVPAIALKGNFNPAYTSLQDFIKSVETGESRQVVGIYVPGILALPVGQQPTNNAGYVTRNSGEATQFNMAEQYGTVGILAHNDLAGALFSKIRLDQYAIVVYGDGRLEYYVIGQIQKFQALSPTSTFSDFVDLNGSNAKLSAGELFTRIYGPGSRLVFQTCIDAYGDASWGRLFIVAEPATSQVLSVVQQTSFLLNFASLGLAAR